MNAELTSTHGTGIDNIPAMAIHGSSGTTNYYYLKDLANTVLALANSSGSIVESYVYDAYGNVTIRNVRRRKSMERSVTQASECAFGF